MRVSPVFLRTIFLHATTSSKRLLGVRVAAVMAFLIAGTGLFMSGAQPIAVGLFSATVGGVAGAALLQLVQIEKFLHFRNR